MLKTKSFILHVKIHTNVLNGLVATTYFEKKKKKKKKKKKFKIVCLTPIESGCLVGISHHSIHTQISGKSNANGILRPKMQKEAWYQATKSAKSEDRKFPIQKFK